MASLGWWVRDGTPYARTQHSGVIDTSRDRRLLLGGVANDTWQLPLSGERANERSQIIAAGERPPGGYANVVYDERGDRVLAPFTRHEAGAFRGELWLLSLGKTGGKNPKMGVYWRASSNVSTTAESQIQHEPSPGFWIGFPAYRRALARRVGRARGLAGRL